MADLKISQLTGASTPLAGTEVLPIVQSGSTVKVANNDLRPKQIQSNATSGVLQVVGPAAAATRVMTVPDANFTAARTDAAQSFTGDQTLSTGNLVQGTAAKGVNFTANTPTAGMTSQLLNWYEEGTWTPSLGGTATYGAASYGRYTRTGRLVTIQFRIDVASLGTGSTTVLSGLPFTSSSAGIQAVHCSYYANLAVNTIFLAGYVDSASTNIYFLGSAASSASVTNNIALFGNNTVVVGSASYIV